MEGLVAKPYFVGVRLTCFLPFWKVALSASVRLSGNEKGKSRAALLARLLCVISVV